MPPRSLAAPARGRPRRSGGASLVSVSTTGSSVALRVFVAGLVPLDCLRRFVFFLAKIFDFAGSAVHATFAPLRASSAVIFQYSSVLNASISRSRSTISFTATDCTRPALRPLATFLPSRFESGKPTTRSIARRASCAATRSVLIFSGLSTERRLDRVLGDFVEADAEGRRRPAVSARRRCARRSTRPRGRGRWRAARGWPSPLRGRSRRESPSASGGLPAARFVLAAVVHDVAQLPAVVDVDAGDVLALLLVRVEVADVAVAGQHPEVRAEVLVDGLRLRRRFDDDEVETPRCGRGRHRRRGSLLSRVWPP